MRCNYTFFRCFLSYCLIFSLTHAFDVLSVGLFVYGQKLLEKGNYNGITFEVEEVAEALTNLARETEELAMKEKVVFSPVLKKWHPIAGGVAAVTLHACYGTLLKQYLAGASPLTNETISVLQRAGKLEKVLVQMVVEDSAECEDGGKAIVREMVPYEVDSIIFNLLKQWMQERLKKGKECLQRAKETEVSVTAINFDWHKKPAETEVLLIDLLLICVCKLYTNSEYYQSKILLYFFVPDMEPQIQN